MRARRSVCAWIAAAGLVIGAASNASAQDAAALRREIDQLRRDFEALKQQYGDRLTALETKLATAEGTLPKPAAAEPAAAQPTAPVPAGAAAPGGPTGGPPLYGAARRPRHGLNPHLALVRP